MDYISSCLGWRTPHCASHTFVHTKRLQLGLKPMETSVIVEDTLFHHPNPEATVEQIEWVKEKHWRRWQKKAKINICQIKKNTTQQTLRDAINELEVNFIKPVLSLSYIWLFWRPEPPNVPPWDPILPCKQALKGLRKEGVVDAARISLNSTP